jgi:hypothetical protein
MPPKSQQPRDKDGKFLPKNSEGGQPPSSLATPSAPTSSSKRVVREASPTQPTTQPRSTSRSRSKRAQPPPESPPKQSSGSEPKQLKSTAENLAAKQSEPQDRTLITDPQPQSEHLLFENLSQLADDPPSDAELDLEPDQPAHSLRDPNASVSVPAFTRCYG